MTAVSLQYPSTRQPINKLAAGVAEEVKDLVLQGGHEGVWAVTHSLGGIVQRHIMGLPDQGTACELSPLTNVQLMLLADACEHDQQTMHALSGCVLTTWYQLEGHCDDRASQPGQHSSTSTKRPPWHRQALPVRLAWPLCIQQASLAAC